MKPIDPDSVPATMEEAVNRVFESIDPKEVERIRQDPEALNSTHFSFGMHVRNSWSFWEPDSPIKRDCVEKYRIAHADDMSGLLMDWVTARVLGQEFDPVAYCERFHAHWAEYQMTSLEAGGWPPKPGKKG